MGVLVSAPTDGTEGDPNISDLVDTESPIAPKDVLVIVAHGACGVNGAAPAMIKRGKLGKSLTSAKSNASTLHLVKIFEHADVPIHVNPVNEVLAACGGCLAHDVVESKPP